MAEKNMSNSLSRHLRQGITYQEKAEDQHNNINTSQIFIIVTLESEK
jgi:hypothetical protein